MCQAGLRGDITSIVSGSPETILFRYPKGYAGFSRRRRGGEKALGGTHLRSYTL